MRELRSRRIAIDLRSEPVGRALPQGLQVESHAHASRSLLFRFLRPAFSRHTSISLYLLKPLIRPKSVD